MRVLLRSSLNDVTPIVGGVAAVSKPVPFATTLCLTQFRQLWRFKSPLRNGENVWRKSPYGGLPTGGVSSDDIEKQTLPERACLGQDGRLSLGIAMHEL